MKADTLLNWDKADLARELANRYVDADDLIESFPGIEKISGAEASLLDEYLEQNWRVVLHGFDVEEVRRWMDEKDFWDCYNEWEEEREKSKAEYMVEEEEMWSQYNEAQIWEYIKLMRELRACTDYAEIRGYPPKWRRS